MLERTIRIPDLHPAQQRTRSEARRFNVLNCGRRWGKTTLGIDVLTDDLLHGAPVAWYSPTYKMLADVWRALAEIYQPVTSDRSEQEHRLQLITGGTLDMWSLDNPDSSRGRKYRRVIIDEAGTVRDLAGVFNTVIRPTLIDLAGGAWFTSTPKGRNGFYQLHLLGRDEANQDWKSWTYTSYDNPYIAPAELDALRRTVSEREYRQEILAEFLENEGSVFRNLAGATNAPPAAPEHHTGHVVVAGVDWGKQDDYTAISIGCADCRQELVLDRFNQIDYQFQTARLMSLLHRWNVATTTAELNSIGAPIVESLQRQGIRIIGFQTTLVSKTPLIESLALAIETAGIQLLPDPAGTAELEAYERTVTETGLSKYSAPAGMHDDTVIARALMYRAMQGAPRSRKAPAEHPLYSLKGL